LDTLFATETMAELSTRQGRVADAIAIYRHLLGTAAAGSDDAARAAKWNARIAELEGGGAGAPEPAPTIASTRPTASAERGNLAQPAVPATPPPATSLVIREPVRSGQVIYAEGRDLIVVASVNPGAQLLADGNIHVYGSLKGRAIAGARGARDAQLFCMSLEAELVGVDTGYVASDDIPAGLWGAPARVFLTPEGACTITALLRDRKTEAAGARRQLR
jgi:septum site-determining protein MinC